MRLNGAVFYYEVKDMQLSAIGGGGNFVQLVNADKGTGMGFELDGEFLVTDRLLLTAGFSYVDTEIEDDQLIVELACRHRDSARVTRIPCSTNGDFAIIDGNPFPQAPEYIATRHGAVRRAGGRCGRVLHLHRLGLPG